MARKFFLFLSLPLVLLAASFIPVAPSARDIINKMFVSIAETKTLTYTSVLTERLNGKLEVAENKVKLNTSPFKSYIYLIAPNKGAEVLYVSGQNENKALIKPNKFPYVNLNLDPHSSLLRDGQHHSLMELGFRYFGEIIYEAVEKIGKDFESKVTYKGNKKWENYDCYVITLEDTTFGYKNYTVKANENLITIGNKLKVSEYMIMEANSLEGYYSVKAGQIIKVPTVYAQKTILYIDQKTFLPVMKAIFDDKGLFEKFEYKNLIKNPKIAPEEFTSTFKDYGF